MVSWNYLKSKLVWKGLHFRSFILLFIVHILVIILILISTEYCRIWFWSYCVRTQRSLLVKRKIGLSSRHDFKWSWAFLPHYYLVLKLGLLRNVCIWPSYGKRVHDINLFLLLLLNWRQCTETHGYQYMYHFLFNWRKRHSLLVSCYHLIKS